LGLFGFALGWLWVGLGSGLGSLGLALELVGLALNVLWRGCEPGLGLFWAGFGLALRLLGLALGWLWVGLGPGLTSFGLALACFVFALSLHGQQWDHPFRTQVDLLRLCSAGPKLQNPETQISLISCLLPDGQVGQVTTACEGWAYQVGP